MQLHEHAREAFRQPIQVSPATIIQADTCSCGFTLGHDDIGGHAAFRLSTPGIEGDCHRRRMRGLHLDVDHRRIDIYRRGDPSNDVIVICSGWAFRYNQLSDGRRQILSVLLPGDVIATSALFQAPLDFSVQALTDVRYSRVSRDKVRERFPGPEFLGLISRLLIAERRDADDQLVDLGQRLAEERIAGLVLRLRARFLARNEVEDESFPFPLRQQHIADITGLTSVHVSRVIGHLRKSGLIHIANGRVTLGDLAELQRIGDMR